jgi:hypothetical protein
MKPGFQFVVTTPWNPGFMLSPVTGQRFPPGRPSVLRPDRIPPEEAHRQRQPPSAQAASTARSRPDKPADGWSARVTASIIGWAGR